MRLIMTLFTVIILVPSGKLLAQSQTVGWLALNNAFNTGKKTGIHFDAQFRSSDKTEHLQTLLLRPGFNYRFNSRMTGTLGYALIQNRREVGTASGYVTEHRIWEQFLYNHNWKYLNISHRFRVEQRWIGTAGITGDRIKTEDYFAAQRLRYFFRSIIPFNGEQSFTRGFFGAVQDEIFGNIGNTDRLNGRFFDQNRLYLALGYRLSKKADLEGGYMNQYVRGKGRSFTNTHIAQFAVYARL